MKIERNKKIRKLRDYGWTLGAIGNDMGITKSRVRTILMQKEQYCKHHKVFYYTNCSKCTAEKEYKDFISSETFKQLKRMIINAKVHREYLPNVINVLKFDNHLKNYTISRILGVHHSLITYHINK
jgi:hypothetical protein